MQTPVAHKVWPPDQQQPPPGNFSSHSIACSESHLYLLIIFQFPQRIVSFRIAEDKMTFIFCILCSQSTCSEFLIFAIRNLGGPWFLFPESSNHLYLIMQFVLMGQTCAYSLLCFLRDKIVSRAAIQQLYCIKHLCIVEILYYCFSLALCQFYVLCQKYIIHFYQNLPNKLNTLNDLLILKYK